MTLNKLYNFSFPLLCECLSYVFVRMNGPLLTLWGFQVDIYDKSPAGAYVIGGGGRQPNNIFETNFKNSDPFPLT